jgi:hypothetical protein
VGEEPADTIQLIGAKLTSSRWMKAPPNSLTEWDVEPGAQGPPIHIHHEHDEGFYVMTGHFGFVLDGITTYAKPGAHVLVLPSTGRRARRHKHAGSLDRPTKRGWEKVRHGRSRTNP